LRIAKRADPAHARGVLIGQIAKMLTKIGPLFANILTLELRF
jgi:hypothetical protein